MKVLHQSFTVTYDYPVYFGEKLFGLENLHLQTFFDRARGEAPQKIFFVMEADLLTWYPTLADDIERYIQKLTSVQWAGLVLLPGGEQIKQDPEVVDRLIAQIDAAGIDRHSYVAAVGGGALLDMVGYAAAITHRGVRHLRFPTTVLAQNDSGVGVKNAINFLGKKNFLGTFAPPYGVFSDLSLLQSLPDRDWRSGISEALKVALIKDIAFFEWIEQNAGALRDRNAEAMAYLVVRCAELHLQHIASGDPFERGSARPLDFGHWAAHKLEYLTDFSVRHGEAVAIGLALDTYYSHLVGHLSFQEAGRVHRLLAHLGLPCYHAALQKPELLAGLQEFREHLGGKLTITLLARLGQGKEVHVMDDALVQQSIAYLAGFLVEV